MSGHGRDSAAEEARLSFWQRTIAWRTIPAAGNGLSYSHGIPLSEEPDYGPLTLGEYLREIARCHGPAEAAVIHLVGSAKIKTADLRKLASDRVRADTKCAPSLMPAPHRPA